MESHTPSTNTIEIEQTLKYIIAESFHLIETSKRIFEGVTIIYAWSDSIILSNLS